MEWRAAAAGHCNTHTHTHTYIHTHAQLHTGIRCTHTPAQLLETLDSTTHDQTEGGRETGALGLQNSLETGHATQSADVYYVKTRSIAQVESTGDNVVIDTRSRWQERVNSYLQFCDAADGHTCSAGSCQTVYETRARKARWSTRTGHRAGHRCAICQNYRFSWEFNTPSFRRRLSTN